LILMAAWVAQSGWRPALAAEEISGNAAAQQNSGGWKL